MAGEETVLKPYCCARLVVDGMAIDVDVGPGEWRGMDLEETWSVSGRLPSQISWDTSNVS